jgi:sulfonate transport system permease protein
MDEASVIDAAPRLDKAALPGDRGKLRRWRPPRSLRRISGPLLIVIIWQLLSTVGLLNPHTLAPPVQVVQTGWDLIKSGTLPVNAWASLERVLVGAAFGISSGLVLAVLGGLFRFGEDLVDSTMNMLRTIPVLALEPLLILWFGLGQPPKIVLIAIATAFPIYLNTFSGIRGVDNGLVEAARTLGLNRGGLIRHVILPAALPGFLVGLRYSLGNAWLVLVLAEQLNAYQGLGYMLAQAQEYFQTNVIVVLLVIYGLLGLLCDAVVRLLERRLLVWRRGFSGT